MGHCQGHHLIELLKHLASEYPNERTYKLLLLTAAAYWSVNRFLLPATNESVSAYYKRKAFSVLQRLPKIGEKIQSEVDKTKSKIDQDLMKVYENEQFLVELVPEGKSKDEILEMVREYQRLHHAAWEQGRMSGAVYVDYANQDQLELVRDVFAMTAYSNPLHVEVFPEIRKMEAEIIRITLNLFNGPREAVGTITSGGTESIILACKAYRDYARYERGIRTPVILAPHTVHAGFDKAAQLLDCKLVHIPIDPNTMKVDVKQMRRAITSDVCLLVGSSPGYPHGIIDPIREIAELGLKYNIPVHVDACLGGFLLPFVQDAGFDIPVVDFRLPGVCSISADTHKYANAPKGTSVLMFRRPEYRHHQYFKVAEWPGGIYATSTIAGSRAGSSIATCWASLLHYGRNGYVKATRSILEAAAYVKNELKDLDGLFMYGDPKLSVIAYGSNRFNIFQLSNELHKLGWVLNPVQNPPGFHICFTSMHTRPGLKEQLVNDIKSCVRKLLDDTDNQIEMGPQAAMYGMAEAVPEKSLINVFVNQYLDSYYSTKS